MCRPQKGNSEVSFNDTLLNFGLRARCVDSRLYNKVTLSRCTTMCGKCCLLINETMKVKRFLDKDKTVKSVSIILAGKNVDYCSYRCMHELQKYQQRQ